MTRDDDARAAAQRLIAAVLARPYSDLEAKAGEILDRLAGAGWRPPR